MIEPINHLSRLRCCHFKPPIIRCSTTNELLRLDKIRVITCLEYATVSDEKRYVRSEKNGILQNLSFTMTDPYALYIEFDYMKKELVIEITGKILRDDYPQLINRHTIWTCFNTINTLGVCQLDVAAIIENGQVCKIDVTKDIDYADCDGLVKELRASVNNFNKYLPRIIANNFVIEKNVTTKGCKKRLTVYNKDEEIQMAYNRSFLSTLSDPDALLQYFKGKTRIELNLTSKNQIRKSLNIIDTDIMTVLNSDANPILDFISEVIDAPKELPALSSYKEYQDYLVLRDNDFDLAKVQAKIKTLRPNARMGRVMPAFRVLVNKIHPGCVTLKDRLSNLLLLEIILIVFPSVLI